MMGDTHGTLEERLRTYSRFLKGEASIGAAWFGDTADGERGRFWWRKFLPLNEAADEIASLRAEVAALKDQNVVHVNMLRGGIARPSVEQIIHIYGDDVIRAALASIGGQDDPIR